MTIMSMNSGAVGLPAGVKEQGKRVDFRPDDFTLAIETKGYRVAWSRTAQCPCTPNNDQTDQADPNCELCGGTGWIQFKPEGAVTDKNTIGELDTIQTLIVGPEYAVIRGLMSAFIGEKQPWDQVTPRLEGTMNLTVRAENKLGYYDRIINLDSTIVYSQILETTTPVMPVKYLIRDVNLLRSADVVYAKGADYQVTDGAIEWLGVSDPDDGTRVVCHYLTHPVWRVIEHPHAMRSTPVKYKTKKPTTPQGDTQELPVQGIIKYEFLP